MSLRLATLAFVSCLAACNANAPGDVPGKAPAAPSATAQADREPDEKADVDPLLAQAGIAHQVVAEAFITAATPEENVDSPASWRTVGRGVPGLSSPAATRSWIWRTICS